MFCGPGSSVGVVTGYGLDGPGIESQWGQDFADRPWSPPIHLYNGYRDFPGGKEWPGHDAAPHQLLVPWSNKGGAIPLLPLRAVQSLISCTRVHFTLPYLT